MHLFWANPASWVVIADVAGDPGLLQCCCNYLGHEGHLLCGVLVRSVLLQWRWWCWCCEAWSGGLLLMPHLVCVNAPGVLAVCWLHGILLLLCCPVVVPVVCRVFVVSVLFTDCRGANKSSCGTSL